jgi:hypothetical protein
MTHHATRDRPDYPDQDEHLITQKAWRVRPVRLSSDGIELLTDWRETEKRRASIPIGGLFEPFCQLGREGVPAPQRRREIYGFARRFGLLGLCDKHRIPAAGCPDPLCQPRQWMDEHGGFGTKDAVRDWILWARRFNATEAMARAITRGKPPGAPHVEAAFAGLEAWYQRMDLLRDPDQISGVTTWHVRADGTEEALRVRPSRVFMTLPDGTEQEIRTQWRRQGHDVEAFQLRDWLNYLLRVASVNRRVVPAGRQLLAITDAYHDSCPLFGALVVELIGRCAGVATQARCANPGCQRGFRPTHQNQRYCTRCRRSKIPLKLAQQYRRNRLRQEGKSARGRPLPKT